MKIQGTVNYTSKPVELELSTDRLTQLEAFFPLFVLLKEFKQVRTVPAIDVNVPQLFGEITGNFARLRRVGEDETEGLDNFNHDTGYVCAQLKADEGEAGGGWVGCTHFEREEWKLINLAIESAI